MFNSSILNLIILLSFTYFVGSLILTSANEFIAAIFRLRQKQLKSALENLFFDPAWTSFVQNILVKSPHIQALMRVTDQYPVYISSKNFVSAIIQQLGPGNFTSNNIQAAIKASPIPASMQQVMVDLLAKTANNLNDFQTELETFYKDSMDRAGGWYKRKIRTIMFFVAGAIAISLNIDTLKIINDSLKNPNALSQAVDNISASMKNISYSGDTAYIKDNTNKITLKMYSGIDTGKVTDTSNLKKPKENFEDLIKIYKQDEGYTLGYKGQKQFYKEWVGSGFWIFLKKLFGILITVFALQLGANYWFDMLNRFINIRAAGKKPGEVKQ